jgi:hypothetical protein
MPRSGRFDDETSLIDQLKLQAYLEQYRRCYQTLIHLNSLAWQVPASTFIITLMVLSLSYQYLTNPLARGLGFLLNAVYVFLMLIQMGAHRKGLDAMTTYMKYLETEVFKIKICPFETTEIIKFIKNYGGWVKEDPVYNKFLVKQRAFFYFQYGFIGIFAILIILGSFNLYLSFIS